MTLGRDHLVRPPGMPPMGPPHMISREPFFCDWERIREAKARYWAWMGATGSIVAAPATGSIVAAPATGSIVAAPATGSIVAAPGTGSIVAAPATGSIVAAPATGSIVAAHATGSIVAAHATGSIVHVCPICGLIRTGTVILAPRGCMRCNYCSAGVAMLRVDHW